MYGTKETLLCNILKRFLFNLPRFYVLEKVLFRRFKARLCVIRVLSVTLPVYVSFANISQYQSSDDVWLDLTDSLHFVQAMT